MPPLPVCLRSESLRSLRAMCDVCRRAFQGLKPWQGSSAEGKQRSTSHAERIFSYKVGTYKAFEVDRWATTPVRDRVRAIRAECTLTRVRYLSVRTGRGRPRYARRSVKGTLFHGILV